MGDQSYAWSRAGHGAGWVAVVDDDDAVRAAVARLLRIEGVRVETFATAQALLAAVAQRAGDEPGCVVLDAHLGGASTLSGFELRDRLVLRARPPVVIMVTAHDELPSSELARSPAPAGDVLRKPFDSDVLVELVRGALAARAAAGPT